MCPCSFLIATFAKESIWGTCSRKMNIYACGNQGQNKHFPQNGSPGQTTMLIGFVSKFCIEPRSPFSKISHHESKTLGKPSIILFLEGRRPEFPSDVDGGGGEVGSHAAGRGGARSGGSRAAAHHERPAKVTLTLTLALTLTLTLTLTLIGLLRRVSLRASLHERRGDGR